MNRTIQATAQAVKLMDRHLRNELLIKNGKLQDKKLWEHTFIKHQIDRRNNGDIFSLSDHIRAMVYSLLSAGIVWDRLESEIDVATGRILSVDKVFGQYDSDYLLSCSPVKLRDEVKKLGCASQYTMKQMKALISVNIEKMLRIEKKYGNIDTYYQKFIDKDSSLKILIKQLSDPTNEDKLSQMGEALTAEYLKNAGYDTAKPDRHIRRILGSKILGCSESETVPINESFDIVEEIATKLNKTKAEVDYILWSYCASGFGEICTVNKPKCENCAIKNFCKKTGV